ncbi:MAG: LPXTG cell wall anchor domain-containing protein, partial [bacterium]|nr:LPXTG cell wall anchor domain-containing protein [bacterium]
NGRLPYEKNRLLNAYLGGDKKCVEKTPETPEKPEQPKVLPKTGAGSIAAGFVSVSAISGLGYNLIARKRK